MIARITHSVDVRWMIQRDYKPVLAIDECCFGAQCWSIEDILSRLRHKNCIGMIAEHHEQVVGFMVYELQRGAFELQRFAVHPWHQRSGVGTAMVEWLKHKLSYQRRERIVFQVRDDLLGGQLFFRAMGFRAVGVEREYFNDGADAYRFQFRL